MDKLQSVFNTAACVVTGTRKFDHCLGQILRNEHHWVDVLDRLFFKLAVTVHRCLNGRAPPNLSDYCIPVVSADSQRHLCSANHQLLAVPCYQLNTYDRRVFSVAAPTVWNSLLHFIQTRPSVQTLSLIHI